MPVPSPTVDNKSLAIGVLSITACILLAAFVVVTAPPATAIGELDSGGDYKILTQQLSSSTEGIVVIDAAAQRMILYGFDFNRRQFILLDGFELERLQKPASDEQAPSDPTRPGRRNP
jgi:hypothetical protein